MTTRLNSVLQALSAEAPGDTPFISVYLDWSVDSTGQRQSMARLAQELDRAAGELPAHGPARESFDADRERLMTYLDQEVPLDARGVAVFACAAREIWAALPLLVPMETSVSVGHSPQLFQLARIIDDHEPFVVATVEGQQAQIFVVAPDSMGQVENTQAPETINRVQAGGWSQLRYQRHTGFMIQLHMNELATALQETVDRHEARRIVIMTNDAVKGHVRGALSAQLQELVVDMVNYNRSDDVEQIMQSVEPLIEQAERQQEAATLERLATQLATKGGLAEAGESAVALAVSKGQVDTLLIDASLQGAASECLSCGMIRPGQRERCPYDGGEMVPTELREALTTHTLRRSGKVQVVGGDGVLAEHGGVAALLRYRDDQQPQTNEVGG